MSYDVSFPLENYKNVFNNYKINVKNVRDALELSFNFNRSPTDLNFTDFWSVLTSQSLLPHFDFSSHYSSIIADAQVANDITANNFMNLLGMVSQLDNYICFASDALSRSIDTSWSFGTGAIYEIVYGILDTSTGQNEIIKKGLSYYRSEIGKIMTTMNDHLNGMDTTKSNNLAYLIDYRDNKFIPEVQKLRVVMTEADKELASLTKLATDNRKNLEVWLPEAFRMVTTVSLSFNLGNKILKVGNKGLIDGSPLSIENRIGMSVAKYWRVKVYKDMSNRAECMTNAILQGMGAISAPGMMEAFITLTWINQVPKS